MTSKKGKTNANSKLAKAEFKGFFNPHVGKDIKAGVKALDNDASTVCARICELVQAGFKLSMVPDEGFTHYTFSIFDRRPGSNSAGYVLSIKHADFATGVSLLWFLVFEVYTAEGWLAWIEGKDDYDW